MREDQKVFTLVLCFLLLIRKVVFLENSRFFPKKQNVLLLLWSEIRVVKTSL